MLSFQELSPRRRFRLGLRAICIIVGIAAAFFASLLMQEEQYGRSLLSTVLVILAALAEFVLADILTEKKYPARTETILERLESRLKDYYDRIRQSIGAAIGTLGACDKDQVSGTFHLIVDLYSASDDDVERAFIQVTDYEGSLGGRRWRFTTASKGLSGRCLRTSQSEWVTFGTLDEYRTRMVSEFGFSPAEVEKHTKSARSYWAEPVFIRGEQIGVLFLFSTELQIFPLAANPQSLKHTAQEISAFLEGAGIV